MDVLFIVVMFVVVSIIDSLSKRKKPRIPPQNSDEPLDFDIPTLANDPNLTVEIRPREVEPKVQSRPKKFSKPEVQNENPELNVDLTPSNVMNAFVLSELLDKPKALRRRRR